MGVGGASEGGLGASEEGERMHGARRASSSGVGGRHRRGIDGEVVRGGVHDGGCDARAR